MKLTYNESSSLISEALGISEERESELKTLVEKTENEVNDDVSLDLEHIGEGCNTPEELAWCSFQYGARYAQEKSEAGSIFSQLMAAAAADDDFGGELSPEDD